MLLAAVLLSDAVTDLTIGETVDSFGTASMTSDMVGALVIVATATPLILLATRRARQVRANDRAR